eukprot:4813637-Prymnesium_polylepis.2
MYCRGLGDLQTIAIDEVPGAHLIKWVDCKFLDANCNKRGRVSLPQAQAAEPSQGFEATPGLPSSSTRRAYSYRARARNQSMDMKRHCIATTIARFGCFGGFREAKKSNRREGEQAPTMCR